MLEPITRFTKSKDKCLCDFSETEGRSTPLGSGSKDGVRRPQSTVRDSTTILRLEPPE